MHNNCIKVFLDDELMPLSSVIARDLQFIGITPLFHEYHDGYAFRGLYGLEINREAMHKASEIIEKIIFNYVTGDTEVGE
jgi:hypothetical protein